MKLAVNTNEDQADAEVTAHRLGYTGNTSESVDKIATNTNEDLEVESHRLGSGPNTNEDLAESRKKLATNTNESVED